MTNVDTPAVTFVEAPFCLSDYLDLSQPVDYFALRLAHIAACNAFVGPEFRAAVEALGSEQAAFLERCIAANYTRIERDGEKPPAGYLMDGADAGQELPIPAIPFVYQWWMK